MRIDRWETLSKTIAKFGTTPGTAPEEMEYCYVGVGSENGV